MPKTLTVPREIVARYRGNLEARVRAFMAAREAHKFTVDQAAPIEEPLVTQIADAGGPDEVVLKIEEPKSTPVESETLLHPSKFRDSFTFEERCAIALMCHKHMQQGRPEPTVLWQDINSSVIVDLDSPNVARLLDLLEISKVLDALRKKAIQRKPPDV